MGAFDGEPAWSALPWLCRASPRASLICIPICWRSTLHTATRVSAGGSSFFSGTRPWRAGISRMEWTFDPLEIKNSFLNVAKLGAIVRRYAPNFYGVSSSRLHGEVPTDRLYAEWWLDSDWVCSALGGKPVALPAVEQEIAVPHQIAHWRHSPWIRTVFLKSRPGIANILNRPSRASLPSLALRSMQRAMGVFQLGRWQEPEFSARPTTPSHNRYRQVFMKIESIVLRELSMSLVHPFATSFGETRERRVLLAEVRAEGLSGWGECTAGEHPYFSEESTDTAWVTILQELRPCSRQPKSRAAASVPGSFARCAATAWPRLRSRMPCGIWKRRCGGSLCTSYWAAPGRRLSAAFPSASSLRSKS